MRIALVAACLIVPAFAQDQQVGTGVNFYSREKEAALGAQLAVQVRRQATVVDTAAVVEYVEKIGQKLANVTPEPRYTFTFAVIDNGGKAGTHEPQSIPGGCIFAPSSLILVARDEGEFVGMLAHSMAHVVARHGTRQATRGQLINSSSIPLIFMGGFGGSGDGNGLAVPIKFLSFQRAFEREADMLAVGFMSRAGWDPKALARYIGRVQVDDNTPFSTLPPRAERINGLEKAMADLPGATYGKMGDDFSRVQTALQQSKQ